MTRDDGLIYIPEMYAVPAECVEAEKANPHSQTRTPIGRVPFLWGQSMYILCSLIKEGYLQAGEIDPLCRRNANYSAGRPPIVLQVAIVAEDEYVQQKLLTNGIEVDTIDDMSPIEVYPSSVLSYIYSQMGQSSKFQLTGRPSSEVGILSTSTIYQLNDRTMVFTPQTIDPTQSYWVLDVNLLSDLFRQNVAYLSQNWNLLGRPTMVLCISQDYFDDSGILHHALASLYRKLIAGYTMGTRVILGKLSEFLTTSCIYKLHYYQAQSGTLDVDKLMKEARGPQLCARPLMPTKRTDHEKRKRRLSNNAKERAGLHRSFIQRTRSIQVDASHMGKIDIRQRAEMRQDGNKAEEGGVSSSPLRRVPEGSMLLKRGSDFTPNEEAFSKTLNISCDELVGLLKETESLTEQAEIIHYLYVKKGSGWNTGLKLDDGDERGVALSVLIRELYDKAGHLKKWWLVRHAAGMLNRKGEDLAKAVSDILVRQKQITVGMANEAEKTISRPLPPMELVALIRDAYGEDSSTAMLTHEILMYLSMLIITEPDLFRDLLVLRIGLIIQVMATELARALKSDGDEAINVLLNLSPFEMKLMLHHILSGKELAVREEREGGAATAAAAELSPSLKRDAVVANLIHVNSIGTKAARSGISKLQKSLDHRLHKKSSLEGVPLPSTGLPIADDHVQNDTNSAQQREIERNGRWLRRRRLDGSLNRIPAQFYSKVWQVLARCKGIVIAECLISTDVTQEMTAKELKFALLLENALNRVPYPEYRQLLVEALMVLILMVDTEPTVRFHSQVRVDEIVRRGYKMFLEDQKRDGGEAIHCCAADPEAMWSGAGWNASASVCGGSAGICLHFYDSAPSGRYGSLTYMCRAVALIGDISVNVENDEDRKDMKRPAFDCNTQ